MLNRICFYLSPPALLIIFFYSFTKKFTWATHFFLGFSLAIAPVGGWVAVAGNLKPEIFILSLGVLAWVSGFDIIYACQDYQFDHEHNIHSIPQRFGVAKALAIAKGLHVLTFLFLASLKFCFDLSYIYFFGMLIIGGMLCYEHSLVKSDDLSRVNMAFFNVNGVIGIIYFLFVLVELLL